MCVSVENVIDGGDYQATVLFYDISIGETIRLTIFGNFVEFTSTDGSISEMVTGIVDAIEAEGGAPWSGIDITFPDVDTIVLTYSTFYGITSVSSDDCDTTPSATGESELVVVNLEAVPYSAAQIRFLLQRFSTLTEVPDDLLYPGWDLRNVWPISKDVLPADIVAADALDEEEDYYALASASDPNAGPVPSAPSAFGWSVIPRVWELFVARDVTGTSESVPTPEGDDDPFPGPLLGVFLLSLAQVPLPENDNTAIWISAGIGDRGYEDWAASGTRSDNNLWSLVVTNTSAKLYASVKDGELQDAFTWESVDWHPYGSNALARLDDGTFPGIVAAVALPHVQFRIPYAQHVADALGTTLEFPND